MEIKTNMPVVEIINGKKITKIPKQQKQAVAGRKYISEIFTPSCVGHITRLLPEPLAGAFGDGLIVQDFLVDSSGLSKGGESMNPLIQVGLNAARKIVFSIKPEACKNGFKVSKPAGVSRGYFSISLGRTASPWAAGGPGFYDNYPAIVTFNNLSGTPPNITYSRFLISNGVNNSYDLYITGVFTEIFSFTDLKIVCNYPARNFLPAFGYYKLLSYAHPLTLQTSDDVCYAMFAYQSPTIEDLGQIVTIF